MRRTVFLVCAAIVGAALSACGPGVPTEKMALQHCQGLARGKMPDVAGNPRYRSNKTEIQKIQDGPDAFEFMVKGEYFFKAIDSGDSELRFTCRISKSSDDEKWTTVDFETVCVGGCV